jgi:aminoglycoside phosphotransferase (APT) family kinase protein
MAGTASPRSDHSQALARFLAAAGDADRVEITRIERLRGGAIRANWGLDAYFSDGPFAGEQRLVLRCAGRTGIPSSLGAAAEFAVMQAAVAAGVAVPEPLFACADISVFGTPFFVMRRVAGIADPWHITGDAALEPARPAIAERLGRELACLHAIAPPRPDLALLMPPEAGRPARQIASFRAWLDRHPTPRPVLEWAMRRLESQLPAPALPVLCHRDFRTGNYFVDGTEVTAILDWEFAGWGDAYEDIGWFCCKGWRFAQLDREAGGIAERAAFYRGYEAVSGRRIEPARVRFWEIMASLRWAVIALQQADRYIIGGERDLDLALTGRRASECELELLMLLDPGGMPADA